MRREKEMEQNLESWIHLRACGFLLCLQSSDSLGDSQPCGHEAKNPPCAPGGQNAARALRFKDCSWSIGHFRKADFLLIDNFSSGSDYREQYCKTEH